jgi:hypothetical protein
LRTFVVDEVLLQHVVDQAAEERGVRSGSEPPVDVADCGGPREPGIDVDHLGPAARADAALGVQLGLHEPLEADRMGLGRIGSVDDDDVGVLDVTPVIRHRAPPECGRQTDDRGAVSDSGLLL